MRHPNRRLELFLLATATAAAVCLAACQPKDPQVRVAQIRSEYTVKLNAWRVVAPETEGEANLGEPGAALGETPAETGARPVTVMFDVLVSFRGKEPLPGITLDITQADPFEKEKDHRRHWIDTSKFINGSFEQIAFELGGFQLIDGDVFSVDLLQFVPEDVRGEYREFAEAGR